MQTRIRLALIYGSAREGRLCDRVAGWAAAEIARQGEIALDIIDPVALDLPAGNGHGDKRAVEVLSAKVEAADAFLVVTPEYNHGYPAALKNLIDAVYEPWAGKPVAFVSYGGISGGLRAVEQLRQVFAELHAVTVRDVVSFANAWERFDGRGGLCEPEGARQALALVLARLHWWANALRRARSDQPYGEIAA
ncbi:MAG TPA: NAD(P)H-dependent oxidoreductase [Paracoccaceae bacterium]|nr:NAD(P)H-dependent oxidoreductase [Paracoccaceae bacterium]